ncbi:hypothetical protein VTL71DRAFT_13215 [Oculimacula yallundae]|uniref:Uncharacterized protein n=1 Tax=Oculimacula yallundae TaxID=86028 RepID=A0ABR4CM07_9HELO
MKSTLILLPALAALCQAAALLQDADILERDEVSPRQVTIVVTLTTTKTSAAPLYTTSTKYTTLPTQVVTKTQTITKPYSPPETTSTVVVTVTAKPTTVTPRPVTVTFYPTTSKSARPPVTITVTVAPPEATEEPEDPEESPANSWQVTRTLPVFTFGKRAPSPAPEADPQRGHRPTRGGGWGPGGQQTIVETQTIKETVTYYPPIATGITRTITITPTVSSSQSTFVSTIYFTPAPVSTRGPVIVTSTITITPTITAAPTSVIKTITPSPTTKSTVRLTVTIWDGGIQGRSPQTLGLPTRTGGLLPTETDYPEDPEEETPEWTDPDSEPTYVLGTPSRTVNVSPTPVNPDPITTKKASTTKQPIPPPATTNDFTLGQPTRTVNVSPTYVAEPTTKKPWWYQPPTTVTVTKYQPQPTGTLIVNSATLPVLTLGGKRALGERQGGAADADVTRSATFAEGAPVKSGGFVTSTLRA